jgi:integrase
MPRGGSVSRRLRSGRAIGSILLLGGCCQRPTERRGWRAAESAPEDRPALPVPAALSHRSGTWPACRPCDHRSGRARWRKSLLTAQVTHVTVAKAYRLLKAIFNTAVDDGLIRRNPCRIKGAGHEASPERPVLTVAQVYRLAESAQLRYRALILVAAFGSFRWGEVAGLRRGDIDLAAGAVRVDRQLVETRGGVFASVRPSRRPVSARLPSRAGCNRAAIAHGAVHWC